MLRLRIDYRNGDFIIRYRRKWWHFYRTLNMVRVYDDPLHPHVRIEPRRFGYTDAANYVLQATEASLTKEIQDFYDNWQTAELETNIRRAVILDRF